ncbi:MAG: hypothetical protein JW871_01750 [Endomicrobiales bacterium]|nr:hypothetical protein [Endomicrobiales bacterium]
MSDFGNFIVNLNGSLNEIGKFIKSVFQKTIELTNTELQNKLKKISEFIQKLPEITRQLLLLLAKNGWYIDPELPIVDNLKVLELFASNNMQCANDFLCNWFNLRLNDIEKSLCEKYPKRIRLLQAAFWAHRNEKYALSIPVFLAQAEGIFSEITEVKLYAKANGKPKFASSLYYKNLDGYDKSFLSPIIEPGMPISLNEKEQKKISFPSFILNRHIVLHGISTDYDNQLNSYKAISFLTYIDWILRNISKRGRF